MTDKFLDFIDMIDGGGAGKFGKEFEGGGIFSMLANALATPYGSEDEERMRRLRQMRGLLAPDESIAPKAAPRPTVTRGGGTGRTQVRPQARPAQSMPFGSTPVGGGMPAAPSMTFGNIPVGGGMPAAAAQNMARPEMPASGMPAAAQNMVRPEMPASGMPAAAADPEFAQFMERAKQDPMMSQFIDNADVMQNIFKMYKQQLSTGRMY
jgi:hypothetical protein